MVSGELSQRSTLRGLYTTHVIHDPSTPATNYVTTRITAGHQIYVIGIRGGGGASKVVCTSTVTNQIIVAPRGCDGPDAAHSLLRANCGQKSPSGLEDNWYLDPRSDECIRAGPQATCLGPPFLQSTNQFFRDGEDDDLSLMAGVVVRSGAGPGCSVPAATRVNIVMPGLNVTNSACPGSLPLGVYETDTQSSAQLVVYTFVRFGFAVELVRTAAENTFVLTASLLGGRLFTTQANFEFGLQMTNPNCSSFRIELIPAPRPLQLAPLVVPDTSNYYKNQWRSRLGWCAFGVGRKQYAINRPLVQGRAPEVPIGGIPRFRTETGLPIHVEADERYADFVGDCARFYPASPTFRGFGRAGFDGPEYHRWVPSQYSCFAPLPLPERVNQLGTIEERGKQCHMLGGTLASPANDLCVMDSWRTYCRRGFLYFDQRCWYKFDALAQAAMIVPSGPDSERVCSSIHPKAVSTIVVSVTAEAWLERFFVFYRSASAVHRSHKGDNRCACYSAENIKACDCHASAFPLCSYHVKSDPIPWADEDLAPETIDLLLHGQSGVPSDGSPIVCDCLAGSGGGDCSQATCVPKIVVAASVNESLRNPIIHFFKLCYANDHGFCVDLDPNACGCHPGFGPPGNLLTGEFADSPCGCDALLPREGEKGTIIIDGQVYANSSSPVCGFVERGACVSTGPYTFACDCAKRPRAGGEEEELAFHGKSCGCRSAHYVPGMPLVEDICNGHGTCCPTGERAGGLIGKCPPGFNGCFCDDGYAGEACTASAPVESELESTTPSLGVGYAYVTQKFRLPVTKVVVMGAVPSSVTARGLKQAMQYTCTQVDSPEPWQLGLLSPSTSQWDCNGTLAWIIRASSLSNHLLSIKVYTRNHGPGGVHVSLTNARHFAIPLFRGRYNRFQELQPWTFARYGVTNSVAWCVAGKIGRTCEIGISAYRLSPETAEWSIRQCGDSTEPRRGVAVGDTCACGAIGTAILLVGSACHCAKVEGAMCADKGSCVEPSFPSGSCSFDQQDLLGDALRVPFSANPPPAAEYSVTAPSYLVANGGVWLVPPGFVFVLPNNSTAETLDTARATLVTSFAFDSHQPPLFRLRPNITYITAPGWNSEERGIVVEQALRLPLKFCVDNLLVIDDYSESPACVLQADWEFETNESVQLAPGTYTDATLFSVQAARSSLRRQSASEFGLLDCSNPVHRLVDDSLAMRFNLTAQCYKEPISAYHSTLGAGYGLFYNTSLSRGRRLLFGEEEWTEDHYRLVDSVIQGRQCDNFTFWDDLVLALTSNVSRESYGPILPNTWIRGVSVFTTVDLESLQLLSDGVVCATHLARVPANSFVFLPCLASSNGLSYVLPTAVSLGSLQLYAFYRSRPYSELFAWLEASILNRHEFPRWNISCSDEPTDEEYLRTFYNVHLAPRRCARDEECSLFSPGASCVLDPAPVQPWLNGDNEALEDETLGIEGGCDCLQSASEGFYNPKFFCSTCLPGYGPDSQEAVRAMFDFAALVPGWIEGGTGAVERCTLPVDPTSTRVSTVCGGRGWVRRFSSALEDVQVKLFSGGIVRRCAALALEGISHALVAEDIAHVDLSSYVNGTSLLTVVYDRVYNGTGSEVFPACVPVQSSPTEFVEVTSSGNPVKTIWRNAFTYWVL